MRKATLIGTIVAAMLMFGMLLVPIVGASGDNAPPLQTTATAEATAPAATAAATAEATAPAATAAATAAPGALPRTGGDSGMSAILLGALALLIVGVAAAILMANRRDIRS